MGDLDRGIDMIKFQILPATAPRTALVGQPCGTTAGYPLAVELALPAWVSVGHV
jgi:hypothetical protein